MPLLRSRTRDAASSAYARLGLTNNPFLPDPVIRPRATDPRANGSIFSDGSRREVISRFEKLLLADFDNRIRFALLWSDGDKETGRGTGKTALLRHFQHRINHDWGQTEFQGHNAAVIYVAFPDQVDRLYSEQMAWAALLDAHESRLVLAAAASLRMAEVERRWPVEAGSLTEKLKAAEAQGIDETKILFDQEALAECGLDEQKIVAAAVERLVDEDIHERLAVALVNNSLLDYLCSLRRDGRVRPYWVSRDVKGLSVAKDILLDGMVKFLNTAGFTGAYLFMDDVENLTDQMANKEAIEFAKEMALSFVRPGRAAAERRFFSVVLTTHLQAATKLARGWGEAGLQSVARMDPMADTSIRVPLPTEDGALEMLAAYIGHHRVAGLAVDRLHPFTEPAARRLVAGVRPALHPRTFIQKAYFAVKHAADAGAERIDVSDIERLLNESGQEATSTSADDAVEGMEHEDY